MRIAVTAQSDEGLDALVAQHFGHAPFFVFVDSDAAEVSGVECLANPFLEGHQPGQIPQFVSEQRADVMLSGGMGARAIQFFAQFGIQAATGASGTVAEAVADYVDGRLLDAQPCADSEAHHHA
jgi:predicted Fe-Mo cluster-binding NifX family protein